MKNILYTLALLICFNSFGQVVYVSEDTFVNVEDLNKRAARAYLEVASNSIFRLSSKIGELENDIQITKAKLKSSEDQLKSIRELYNAETEKVTRLSQENAKISVLENDLVVLQDSIAKINDMVYRYQSQINLDSTQWSNTSASDAFLNDFYLGNDNIENQNFRLKPAGIISVNDTGFFDYKKDTYSNNQGRNFLDQFFPISDLNLTIEKKIDQYIYDRDITNYKNTIESNSTKVVGENFFSSHSNILPKFSFLRGKLLTVTSGDFTKDFLFSVKKSNDSPVQFSGQKPLYFSLTDDEEKEYLFGIVTINNEVYLMLNKNDLLTLGWYELSTKHYNTVIKKKRNGRSSESSYDYDDPETSVLCSEYYNDSSGYRAGRFIPCEDYEYKIESNGFIVASTKKTLYRDSKIITPLFMLFKFERL
tara:strand:- start:2317 stop:3579 length:1263 start_codon:yes stop_codon:yes gene_type:complete